MLTYPKPLYYLKPFDSEVLARIAAIPWLSEAGQTCAANEWQNVTDAHEAVSLITAPEWDDFRLEMRNETTGFLAKRWSKNYTEWNNSAIALRVFWDTELLSVVEAATVRSGLPSEILDEIRWDVLTYLQEEAFRQCQPPRFFDRLMLVYEQGRLPCSINSIDTFIPDGKIVVY